MVCGTAEANEGSVKEDTIIQKLKRPLFISLIIGLVLRFILAPTLTYEYDIYHWAVIMQNINSGNGLYELTGYFYLPVWGYMMGFMDMIWNTVLAIDVFGNPITALIPLTDLKNVWHLSTITTPAFNVAFKIPLIIVDLIVGWLVYKFTMEITKSRDKADMAFALWFLCPIVFYMTGVQAMFDNISALLLLLCFILVFKEHYLFAGAMLMMASLLKLYPIACGLILIVYLFKRYDKHTAGRNLAMALIGAVACAVLVMIPNIIHGDIASTLTFITDRGSRNSLSLIPMILAVLLELFIAWRFAVEKEDLNMRLIKYSICAIVILFLMGYNPQYAIVYVPLLAIYIVAADRSYMIVWWGTLFVTVCACIQDNFSLLCSSVVYYGWLSPEWLIDMMRAFETEAIFGLNFEEIVNLVFSLLFNISLIILVVLCLKDTILQYVPKMQPLFDYIDRKWGARRA